MCFWNVMARSFLHNRAALQRLEFLQQARDRIAQAMEHGQRNFERHILAVLQLQVQHNGRLSDARDPAVPKMRMHSLNYGKTL